MLDEKALEDLGKDREQGKVTFTWGGVLEGFRMCLPIALGVFTYGLVFGVLARQAGLSLLEGGLMSLLVFAGASQFTALGMWAAPLPILTIILTTFIVNLRHILMGAALRPWFANLNFFQRYGSVFFLTDENWALTMGQFAKGKRDAAFLVGSGLALFIAWTGSGVAGQTLGNILQDPAKWGLDFAFSAVFLALLVGMWKGKSDLLPWLVAAGVAILTAQLLPDSKWYILFGGLSGSIVGALRHVD
jgi:4-azaleucine resistance transporter AzlC